MRAYKLPVPGSIDALAEADLPIPKPGRGQVLVKVAACSLNYRDLAIVLGRYRAGAKPDLVPLSDGAGEVVEVGADVTQFKPGDRVAGCFFQRWWGGRQEADAQASALGGSIDGVLAEYVVLEQDGAVPLPAHLSFEEGATLPCAGLTAWHAVVEHGQTVAGNCVLVQGTGGVSIFALQFAKMLGAEVIAISSSDEKLARARALGADHLINYRTTPDWDKAARELTGGRGVDVVVEVGGTGTLARSLNALRLTGRVGLIGAVAGPGEFDPMQILVKRANVQGISVGSRQMFLAMNRAISVNGLKPVIDRVFPFAEARDAFRHLQSAAHFGKVVIAVAR